MKNLLPATTSDAVPGAALVPVGIDEPTVTEEQAIEAMKALGLIELPAAPLSSLEKIGVYVRGAGILRNQRGTAVANQQWIFTAMRRLSDTLSKGTKKDSQGREKPLTLNDQVSLTKSMALLASTISESQKVSIMVEHLASPTGTPEEPAATVPSFTPGKPVVPAGKPGSTQIFTKEVHYHGAEPVKTP